MWHNCRMKWPGSLRKSTKEKKAGVGAVRGSVWHSRTHSPTVILPSHLGLTVPRKLGLRFRPSHSYNRKIHSGSGKFPFRSAHTDFSIRLKLTVRSKSLSDAAPKPSLKRLTVREIPTSTASPFPLPGCPRRDRPFSRLEIALPFLCAALSRRILMNSSFSAKMDLLCSIGQCGRVVSGLDLGGWCPFTTVTLHASAFRLRFQP